MRIEPVRPILSDYTLVIIITFVLFVGLAALLLVPVYRFLKREEQAGKQWTDEHVDPWIAGPEEASEMPETSRNGADSGRDAP